MAGLTHLVDPDRCTHPEYIENRHRVLERTAFGSMVDPPGHMLTPIGRIPKWPCRRLLLVGFSTNMSCTLPEIFGYPVQAGGPPQTDEPRFRGSRCPPTHARPDRKEAAAPSDSMSQIIGLGDHPHPPGGRLAALRKQSRLRRESNVTELTDPLGALSGLSPASAERSGSRLARGCCSRMPRLTGSAPPWQSHRKSPANRGGSPATGATSGRTRALASPLGRLHAVALPSETFRARSIGHVTHGYGRPWRSCPPLCPVSSGAKWTPDPAFPETCRPLSAGADGDGPNIRIPET